MDYPSDPASIGQAEVQGVRNASPTTTTQDPSHSFPVPLRAAPVSRTLRVLQANLRKSPEIQLSLLNDPSLQHCDLLMISEPYLFPMNGTICSHTHANWAPLWLSQRHPPLGRLRPHRSMVWVNQKTFPHRQIDITSADIAAVLLFTPFPILAMSVYIAPGTGREGTRALNEGLHAI
ncbi:hypothetical protein E8E15_000184 [Penicillium rubens]|nr:hypothetical protein E8E15_000184 [Penicillium rubens]